MRNFLLVFTCSLLVIYSSCDKQPQKVDAHSQLKELKFYGESLGLSTPEDYSLVVEDENKILTSEEMELFKDKLLDLSISKHKNKGFDKFSVEFSKLLEEGDH